FCLIYLCLSTFLYLFTLVLLASCLTFFPYSTLFRSSVELFLWVEARSVFHVEQDDKLLVDGSRFKLRQHGDVHHHVFLDGFAHLDRKSTCLNSSHVSISYAVFCLKKNI